MDLLDPSNPMTTRPLVQVSADGLFGDHAVLRRPTKDVTDFGVELERAIAALKGTLMSHKIAIGLAAPQIGIDLSVAVVNVQRLPDSFVVFCNPTNVVTSGKKRVSRESCMSVPGLGGPVERRDKVAFSYQKPDGTHATMTAEGFLARVLCHEIDHLRGILYVDLVTDRSAIQQVDLFNQD
jgi:peptide deformylase